ncbi:MAG: hypothetical protein ACXQTW_08605 [Candidatus Methanospirareceae archaeon]
MTEEKKSRKESKRGYFRKRYSYTQDMQLKFIKLRNDSRKQKEYNDALRELIYLIYNNISPFINYSHINLTIPRANLPTKWEGAHADIVYLDRNKSVVFLMMHVQPYEKVKREVEKVIWQRLG